MFTITTGFGKSMRTHKFDDYGNAIHFLETSNHKRVKLSDSLLPSGINSSVNKNREQSTTSNIINKHW